MRHLAYLGTPNAIMLKYGCHLFGFAFQRSGPGDMILLAPDLTKIRLAHHAIGTYPEHLLSTACGDAGGIDKAPDKSTGLWYLQQLVIMVGLI